MIRPLRRLHRWLIVWLALILVALFVASLIARKPVPTNSQIPDALLQGPIGGQR
ncbi:MAG TPA: hypothetical protein PLK30_21085 [Blastocatellia bacterium]|nr:hypothetical protein [Blastocatellia bacterium]